MTAARITPADPTATTLLAQVHRFVHRRDNDDGTEWVVLALVSGETASGTCETGEIRVGGTYRLLGRWADHPRFGWQFTWETVVPDVPVSPEGMISYLARHCDGVGEVTARKLVDRYGEDVILRLVNAPETIDPDLISPAVAQDAGRCLKVVCDPALRQAHLQCHVLTKGMGFYAKAIKQALRRWGARAGERLRRDPFTWLTAGLPGCGFLKCDRLYCALGHSPARLKRQALAAWYRMDQMDEHTWISLEETFRAVKEAIGSTSPRPQRALALLCRTGAVCHRTDARGETWFSERQKASAERTCAIQVRTLRQGIGHWPRIEETGLDGHQADQIRGILDAPLACLVGTPGTGKTYCAAALIRAAIRHIGGSIAVCAPTGKAAVRLNEKLAEAHLSIRATTIHRLLEVQPCPGATFSWSFARNAKEPLSQRVVIVDETSMVDVSLASALLSACSPGTHVLFVGDPNQLPPVGHGAFLRDLLAAGVPTACLSEIRRNSGAIVNSCASIKDGKTPSMERDLDKFIADPQVNLIHQPIGRHEPEDQQRALEEKLASIYRWLREQKRWDLIDDVQILCARNATRHSLNGLQQQALNAAGEKGPKGFRVSDKVICLKNGFLPSAEADGQVYVCNGDLGRVHQFAGGRMRVHLRHPDRQVWVPLGKAAAEEDAAAAALDDRPASGKPAASWDRAYAITTHKSQGSEWPVVIVLVEGAGKLGSREHLYTSISRSRELCIVVGERADISRYVRNTVLPDRKTFLRELIRGEVPL